MRGFQLITLLAALATVCLAEYKRYDGYQLLRIYPKDSAQADYVFELSGDDEIDFWYEGRDRFDILVPPHKLEAVKYMMTSHDVVYKVENSNVQRDIDMEQIGLLTKKKEAGRAVDYDNYNTLQDILMNWMSLRLVAHRDPCAKHLTLETQLKDAPSKDSEFGVLEPAAEPSGWMPQSTRASGSPPPPTSRS